MYTTPSTILLATLATLLATTSSLHLPASFARRNIEPRVPATTAFIYPSSAPPAASPAPPKPRVKTLTRLTTRYVSAPLPTKRPVRVTTITLPAPVPKSTKRPSPPKPKPRPTKKPAASPPAGRPRPAAPMISNYAPFANGRTIPPISAPLPTRRPGLPAVHHPPPRPAGNGLPAVHHPPRPVAPRPRPSPRPTARPAAPKPKPAPSKPVGIIITPLTQTTLGGKTTYIPIPTAKPKPKPKPQSQPQPKPKPQGINGERLLDLIGQVGKLPKPKPNAPLMTAPGPTPIPKYPGLPKAKEEKDKEAKARALLEGLRGMQGRG
ncbi:hypothetical protein TI39_contig586g00004 [Zymoseptoria brevis]|uniref:Uncharacterized protein n=1 Tax=Zymoseptoria brevis TaxID=1047168 RepID=A0A0F4GI24_9PEZI|nr:hypothetical protein TI39_contig586g00004 [Zymoseptoria brevis]